MRRLQAQLQQLLRQGTRPEELSLTISLGLLLASFPVLGSTTLLCTIAALALRLNLPLIMLINYLAYPLQLALYIPLLLVGASVFDPSLSSLTLAGVYEMLKQDFWGAIGRLFWANLGAILVWGAAAAPLGFLLHFLMQRLMRHWHQPQSSSL